jgi:hypothetical protein
LILDFAGLSSNWFLAVSLHSRKAAGMCNIRKSERIERNLKNGALAL